MFTQKNTLEPFTISDQKKNDLLHTEDFKEVKNREFIISICEDFLNNLFFRFEKKNIAFPHFILKQLKTTLHLYVRELKAQRDAQVLKNRNIKSFEDLTYRTNLFTITQRSTKNKNHIKFEDISLNFKFNTD